MFTIHGHDNGLRLLTGREDVRRCASCGLLLDKWQEDLPGEALKRLRFDVSYSYDGVLVVSRRFRDLYEGSQMKGLEWIPLGSRHFAVRAAQVVTFDAKRRGTRFINRCQVCGQYESVVGAAPAFLAESSAVDDLGFARTDLEFGSADEKAPVLICGDAAAEILRGARLRGLDLEEVRCP